VFRNRTLCRTGGTAERALKIASVQQHNNIRRAGTVRIRVEGAVMIERRTLIALGLSAAAVVFAALGTALPARALDAKAQQLVGVGVAAASLTAHSR
jgi:hypothetical protein